MTKSIEELRETVLDRDYVDFKFTAEDLKNLIIPTRGSMRIGMGLSYSADEWERKRERILKTPLP